MVKLSLHLDESTNRLLNEAAHRDGKARSALVREIILARLDEEDRRLSMDGANASELPEPPA